MKLDHHTLALIGVGASVTANCQLCLEHNVGTALACGADGQEIAEAIDVGRRVRQGAAAKMDQFAVGLNNAAPFAAGAVDDGCGCRSQVIAAGGPNG
jgi:AhpD family alkylhydroperoxidase